MPVKFWQRAAALAAWIVVWQLAAVSLGHGGLFLATPIQTLQALAQLVPTAGFWQRIVFSALRILTGCLLAVVGGLVLGALGARWRWVRIFIEPAMQLIREGKKDEALKLLEYGKKMIPSYNVPYDPVSVGLSYSDNRFMLPDAWRLAGKPQEAERILLAIGKNCRQYVNWYNTLSDERLRTYATDCYRQYIFLSAVTNGLRDCGSKHAAEYEKFVKGMVDGRIGPMLMMAIQPN